MLFGDPGKPSRPSSGSVGSVRVAAVEAEGLVKIYRSRKSEVRALDGVDLEVREGTVLGLLGPNGAGKTTTVRILATLLTANAGSARVAGFDVEREAQSVRKAIGLSGQYAASRREPDRAREPLDVRPPLPPRPRAEARDAGRRAARALRARGRRRPGRQDVLRRDAPTARPRRGARSGARASCSSTSRRPASTRAAASACGTSIRTQVREGATVLLTTQYLEEADELADEIAVVDQGKIIAQRHRRRAEVAGRRRADRGRRARARRPRPSRRCSLAPDGTATTRRARPGGSRSPRTAARRSSSTSSAARRGRDQDRRHRPAPADARRRLPRAHRPRGRGTVTTTTDDGRMSAARARPSHDGRIIDAGATSSACRGSRSSRSSRSSSRSCSCCCSRIVFGGAIPLPGGGSYREYLMPGIFVQTLGVRLDHDRDRGHRRHGRRV